MTDGKKIKVLQLISALHIGGAEKVVTDLVLKMDPDKYDVSVCCIKNTGVLYEKIKSENIPVYILSEKKTTRVYMAGLHLIKLIRDEGHDILHSHNITALFDGSLASLLNRKVKHIHTFHFGNYPHLGKKKYLLYEKIASRVPHQLVAVSDDQREKLIKYYSLSSDRVQTVYNGVAPNKYWGTGGVRSELQKEFSLSDNDTVFGTVAVMTKQKGLADLLETAKIVTDKNRNAKFLIVGYGTLKDELEEQAKRLGLTENVIFTGMRTDVGKLLHVFDVFLMSSLWEGLPIALLEALAAGKPVVCTDVGDNSKVVQDGVNGYVVPPKSPEKMAAAIFGLLENREEMKRMGGASLDKYENNYTVSTMLQSYSDIYHRLLGY